MKITFVTDTYAPQANGVATTLHRLVSGLKERGNEVDVIRPASLLSAEDGLEVPSLALPGYQDVKIGLPMRLILQSRWHKNRPDVIYVATETPLGLSAINAARALNIPSASGFHTNFQQYMAHYRVPFLEKATMCVLRRIHNRSDCTFAPSRDTIKTLDQHGFKNLALLPKGVDTKLFNPNKRRPLLRNSWGVRGSGLAGLYVGRIAAEKNLDLVVKTFKHIRQRIPDFRGVFVGEGPKLKELKKQHPEFIYTGVLRGTELAEHYASADLFIFPSITETFGNVTLEAMASGLVTVAYDYAAAKSHIKDCLNGFTAPFDDEDAFIDKAIAAATTPQICAVREQARRTARKVRWKKVVKRFEKAMRHLSEGKHPEDWHEADSQPTCHEQLTSPQANNGTLEV